MRTRLGALIAFLALVLCSCTDASIITRRCSGGFTIYEEFPCAPTGAVTVTGSTNVTAQSLLTFVQPTADPMISRVLVTGVMTDPCAIATIDYNYVCNGTTVNRSKTLDAGSLSATGTTDTTASPSGGFSYPIAYQCCSGNTAEHDISIVTLPGRTVFVASLPKSIQCQGSGTLTISGQLSDPSQGTSVDVTISGPNGSCRVTTNVRAGG